MDVILVLIISLVFNNVLFSALQKKHLFFDRKLMTKLYWFHLLFFGVYYTYALFNPSDSKNYYFFASTDGDQWLTYFETSTKFITFVAIPFVNLGMSYTGLMLLFAWFGYVGFLYAYLFFKENLNFPLQIFKKYDFVILILFLPNMHFWTVSLGKGSLIFMGMMLFIYALKFPLQRWFPLLLGGFIVYMIRPHVMLFMLVGVMVGMLFGKEKKISGFSKFLIIVSSVVFLALASNSILAIANLDQSENVVQDFESFADKRSVGLSESAGSGVSMNSYPLPLKLFTFWFRPLFVDSPSALGLFSSLENLLYLLIFLKIINKRFIAYIKQAPYLVKTSLIIFLLSSFALTFVMSNLGLIMRQKSMVMYFGFFVIASFLAHEQLRFKTLKSKKSTLIHYPKTTIVP